MCWKRYIFLLVVVALCLCNIATCEESESEETPKDEKESEENGIKEESDVLVLTKDNFDEAISSNDNIMVEFYAPWCGHCKSLEPEYAKAAKVLKTYDPPIPLAKVDATVETDLASRFDVSGYPTLKFFKKGQPYDFDGARSLEGILRFVKDRADPDWKPPPEAVVTLTKENFKNFIDDADLSLVEFYAPWCGHCKQLAPEYEKAAKQLKELETPIPLGKVDATVETELAKEYEVSGYPTIFMFRKGRKFEYSGPRDQHGIVNHMINHQGEGSKLKVSLSEVKAGMKRDEIFVMGFFNNLEDPQLRVYMDAANNLREEFSFGHSLVSETRDAYKVNPRSVVVFAAERFYTKYEPKWHVFKMDDSSVNDVMDFVRKHQTPLVGQYHPRNMKLFDSHRPLCFVFYTVDWSFDHRDATQLWRKKVAKIANDHKDVKFAIADEDDHSKLLEEFGLDDSGEEINIGCYGANGKRYGLEPMEEWEDDDVDEFISKMKIGKLEPHVKSQPIPKRQDGPVKVVVGKTFDSIVRDKTKDVLIEMYAPWCGHCKHLEPIYKQLAKNLKHEKNLVIAKMDATANDVPDEYKVEGFPTIYFATSENKDNPLKFEGGRKLEDFEKYLKEHATVSFKGKEEL